MEKTIKIGNKSVRLSNNIGWAMEYRDQFGRDIVPSLTPAIAGLLDIMSGIVNETGKVNDIGVADIIGGLGGDSITDAMIHLSGLEFVDFINITWALAKTADESIPDPREWVREFEYFPVDVIAPEVFELVVKGLTSSKNWQRLKSLKKQLKTIQPESTLTPSSSQESNED